MSDKKYEWFGHQIPHAPVILMGGCDCIYCAHRRDINLDANMEKAVVRTRDAQAAARGEERILLVCAGWKEKLTTDEGTTWWYMEGHGGSEPQRSAVRLQFMEHERASRARREQASGA